MPTLAIIVTRYHRARLEVAAAHEALDAVETALVRLRTRMANYARMLRDTTLVPAMRIATRENMAEDRAAVLRWRRSARLRCQRYTRAIAQDERARITLARALRARRAAGASPSSPPPGEFTS